jgi:hypothetical protein
MAHVFVATDHRTDPYILKTLPTILGSAGHAYSIIHPLEKIVEAAEHAAMPSQSVRRVIWTLNPPFPGKEWKAKSSREPFH